MFLYDKKGTSLDVYEFKSNKQATIDYRISQMSKIDETNRVLVAEAYTAPYEELPLFEFYSDKLDSVIIPIEEANKKKDDVYNRYHLLQTGKISQRSIDSLLERYYLGQLSDRKVATIQDLESLRYFLLNLEKYESTFYDNRKKIMRDIIELPESLYLLQLLEQEKFSLIGDKDISEQLSLYSISHINEINLMELAKMDEGGITQNAYQQTLNKAENDANILKLIKK